jgi:hypothetical protein
MRSRVTSIPLADLATTLEGEPGVGTLYVPAVAERDIEDAELLRVMVDSGAWPRSPFATTATQSRIALDE